MVADHLVHVGLVELLAGLLLQLVVELLRLVRHLLRQLDALLLRDLLQLVVRLAVVLDHALAELLDRIARRLLLRQLAEPHLHQAALRRLGRELHVLLRELLLLAGLRRLLLLCGVLILGQRRPGHQTDDGDARQQVLHSHVLSSS